MQTFVEPKCRRFLESGHNMRVSIESDTDATVTQTLTHYLWMDMLSQHKAGMGMAEVMEPETR